MSVTASCLLHSITALQRLTKQIINPYDTLKQTETLPKLILVSYPRVSVFHNSKGLEKSVFTRDPSQLTGALLRTSLKKSTMGFGFTIIGGDRPDEFLQVKNVLKDGPAAQDGRIAPGQALFL